ncbi:hypothetical protein [Pseudoduganella aquatica]|uniref:DUF1640 domain-containing protein n=1 Tax=Pseudoduganella aquatica TaxID=2660641 RepID=A0A7X4H893_9BURK|nr:hypothetical protein [Pseudoduganella aquatica]MYN06034.1 hypothetical protein [Pseudoduganella aquatica]
MTMPIRIDKLKYAQLLKEGGLPAEQAELHAESLSAILDECHVAVESDLVIQRSELLARMDLLKQEIFGQMDLLKQDMLNQMNLIRQEMLSKIHEVELALSIRMDGLERRMAGIETRFYLLFGIQFVVDAVILFKLYA